MTKQEFIKAMHSLKEFQISKGELERGIQALSPNTSKPSIGDSFVDSYITLLEKAAGDRRGLISEFVYSPIWPILAKNPSYWINSALDQLWNDIKTLESL